VEYAGDVPLLTIGHGTDGRERLGARLAKARVRSIVDVRRFPGSRANPDVASAALTIWLPDLGIDYRWDQRLGGRRRLSAGEDLADAWWRVPQFAAYAAHTRTPEFAAALDEVLADATTRPVAVMCSEYVWWRCHRRLIADVAVLAHEVEVRHAMPDGSLADHRPANGARLGSDGLVWWDRPVDA
jgi:uncharacterized protein (DUF488 family)